MNKSILVLHLIERPVLNPLHIVLVFNKNGTFDPLNFLQDLRCNPATKWY